MWIEAWRDILVVVAGLTPQVITEALYYLTQVRDPPLTIAEIYVLTTYPGRRRILDHLLTPDHGHFYTLCSEYQLDPAIIAFDAAHIHVLSDAAGVPLEDIRTADDNAAVADQILALMRRLTADPATRLHCSLAGGRKTQSVLLGFALQLYGRPQDTLLHVLVDEAFEGCQEFFYPTRASRLVRGRDGQPLDAHAARVDVAEIPYVRLRATLFGDPPGPTTGFDRLVAHAQQRVDLLPNPEVLLIVPQRRCIYIGRVEIMLRPLELVLYTQLALARRQRACGDGFLSLDALEGLQDDLLRRYAQLYARHSERVAALRQKWSTGFPRDSMRSHFANINRKIEAAVSDRLLASFYTVNSQGQYGATSYGLRLPPEHIDIQEE
jgi:CRISPR-associated protein (TIGR02584 family)